MVGRFLGNNDFPSSPEVKDDSSKGVASLSGSMKHLGEAFRSIGDQIQRSHPLGVLHSCIQRSSPKRSIFRELLLMHGCSQRRSHLLFDWNGVALV